MQKAISISEALLVFIWASTILVFFQTNVVLAQCGDLPHQEKNAFYEIAAQLGKRGLDSKLNPCDLSNVTVICSCSSYPDGLYHIEGINFSGQDLAGVLPPSLAGLPHLKQINLTRNYISGTIPQGWASSKLEFLSFGGNRLSGPIPKYLGNFTTLTALSLENNQFNGSVLAEMGNLVNMERLYLSAYFLTGILPMELNNLKNLKELRLSSNNFTGRLPIFTGWSSLQNLEMQACGFQGPIPSTVSVLTNLTELKISDLSGVHSEFPPLQGMKSLANLMLRSCSLSGIIPPYLANLPALLSLDLSFNKLQGEIPNLANLSQLETMYLTGNFLSGSIPDWIKGRDPKQQFDLSYNNFTESSVPSTCEDPTLNLYRSYNGRNPSELVKCLTPCRKDWYSFNVNCGGKQTTIGDVTFDEDEEPIVT